MRRAFVASALLVTSSLVAGACSSRSTQPSASVVLHACAIASACSLNGAPPVSPLSDECELLALVAAFPSPRQTATSGYGCYFSATDCASFESCLMGPRATAAQLAACSGSKDAQCQGNVAVDCGSGYVQDCGSVGYVCGLDGQSAICGPQSCDSATFTPHCQGNTSVSCSGQGGVVQEESCDGPLQEQVCVEVSGYPYCEDPSGTCDPSFQASCQGTVATNCKNGLVTTLDCGAIGLGVDCRVLMDGTAACQGTSGCNDDDGTTKESCNDGIISLCIFGTTTTLDCRSYGLSGCTTTALGGGRTFAACTP